MYRLRSVMFQFCIIVLQKYNIDENRVRFLENSPVKRYNLFDSRMFHID